MRTIVPPTSHDPSTDFRAILPFNAAPRLMPRGGYVTVKRGFDVAASALLLVVSSPILVLSMLAVRLTSRGPALYSQTRVGLGRRTFTIYKLRTMVHDCESLTGPRWCIPGDPRITPLGRVLRKLHIDELPQLWNVLRGDMSLIGPRPERPEFVRKLLIEVPNYDDRHLVPPGITGLAQVQQSADMDFAGVSRKLQFDRYYIAHLGPALETAILVATAFKIVGVSLATLQKWMGVVGTYEFESFAAPMQMRKFRAA